MKIDTIKELRKALRHGQYAWPGGYEIFFITSDGAMLCRPCVIANLRSIIESVHNQTNDGWNIVGMDATCNVDLLAYESCDDCDHVFVQSEETTP